jgi:flagella basal body P-ring formation protein FlgA
MLAFLLAVLTPLGCQTVSSDWIHGQDLAKAVPALATMPADAKIGPAPLPGQQRVFRVPELKRIAHAYRLTREPGEEVCFAWETAVPEREVMRAAMARALAGRDAQIDIVEASRLPVPKGELQFPLSGLTLAANHDATLWRGYVQYGETRRFPVWARVLVTVGEQHLVAVKDFEPGQLLARNSVRVENYQGPLLREHYLRDPSEVEGMLLRGPIRAGSPLLGTMLETPFEVNRGDMVNAIVQNGAARLEVQARAEDNGRKGQVITMRNLRSGRLFRARVVEKGTVLVVPGGPIGLALEAKKL